MLHLRYSAEFWICFDFRICQSSEYTRFLNISGLHKVLNKIFRDRCLTVFWICLGYWICHGPKYPGVTQGLKEIFPRKYLTGFWICLEFWKYQCCTGFCRKQPIIHDWQVSEYSLGSQSYKAWIYMVVNMSRLPMVLHKLCIKGSLYFECLEFWIC